MSEHTQVYGSVRVPEPFRSLTVELVRRVDLSLDGSEVVRRRPEGVRIRSGHKSWSGIRLKAAEARIIGMALCQAADQLEEEQDDGNRV